MDHNVVTDKAKLPYVLYDIWFFSGDILAEDT